MMNNLLVTGGNGLVGKNIDVGNKPPSHELNLLDYTALKYYVQKHDIKEIIHCAAKVGGVKANKDFIFDFFSENLSMNANILRVCKECNIQKASFILSTCIFSENAEYPLTENQINLGEPHNTNYGYAYAKRMLYVGSKALKEQYNINTVCLIPTNLYGENDYYNVDNGHVIPSLIHRMYIAKINDEPMVIWGSGSAEREFLYAKDFSEIILNVHNNIQKFPQSMIVSNSIQITIKELVFLLARLMDYNGEIIFDKSKPEGIIRKPTNNTLFVEKFGEYKFTSLEQGLKNTINYFINNYDKLRK